MQLTSKKHDPSAKPKIPVQLLLCDYPVGVGRETLRRRVHPEVCKWHRAKNDPACKGCKREKARGWMNGIGLLRKRTA